MAGQSVENIPLSAISPQYLHANSTSHTWAFGAFAELIDNAYDPDVSAKQQWIDLTRIKDEDCLIFMDNGAGLDYDKMLKMMSFGYSDKKTIRGHAPVGLYGNGFKSGAMRLGKDAIVFSKTRDTMSVGLLSQTYLAAIQAQHIAVPIVTYRQDGEGNVEPGHADCLTAILQHSLFQNEEELLQELNAINNMPPVVSTGTRIIIWNLRRPNGQLEFDLQTSRYDIQIPRVDSGADQDPRKDLEPESSYSLRAYCSILYLKPRMQIIIRGLKVRTQLVSKSLAHTLKDRYTPQFLRRPIIITFGYNPKTSAHYGIMMYHKKRLIRAYEHVGCQRQAKPKGVGIIGIIECDFLKPTHNKQDFDASEEYRKVKSKLGEKLEEYWNQMRHMKLKKDPKCTLAVEDMERSPDQNWVQCNTCQKWRKLPDGINASRLPDEWFCFQNPDPQYRSCQIEEELEDSEDEQPYQKTYRQAISWEMRQQLENRQQNAAGAVSTLSTYATPSTSSGTNRGISGATAGGDVTRLTTPPSTPLSRSGCRPSARNTPRIPSILSTPTHPRSRRLLLSPESEPVKRAKVKDHSLLPMAQETEEAISPQLCDGALAEESMDTSGTATAATPPSAVHQQVSVSTQTGGVAKVEEGTEEITRSLGKEEPMSSEEIQLPNGETRELADSSHQMKLFLDLQRDRQLEQLEITMKERDHYKEQMETASQERDRYRCQVEAANQERDQYQERMEAASQERDCYRSKVEAANQERDQYMEQVNKLYQELQQMRSGSVKLEQSDQAPGGNEDPILLLDSVLRDLDSCNEEREQLKSKLESVEAERGAVISQCEELKTELGNLRRELEDLREAGTRAISHSPSEGTGNGPTTPGSAETERLRTLRVSVSRLLVILIPSLELDQVDYNSTVIDEILEQYLDGISSEAM